MDRDMDLRMMEERRLIMEKRSLERMDEHSGASGNQDSEINQPDWRMKTQLDYETESETEPHPESQCSPQIMARTWGAGGELYRNMGGQSRDNQTQSEIDGHQGRGSSTDSGTKFYEDSQSPEYNLGGDFEVRHEVGSRGAQGWDMDEYSLMEQEQNNEAASTDGEELSWGSQELWGQMQWEMEDEAFSTTGTHATEDTGHDLPQNLLRTTFEDMSQPSDQGLKRQEGTGPQFGYFADDESSPDMGTPDFTLPGEKINSQLDLNVWGDVPGTPSSLEGSGTFEEYPGNLSSSGSFSDFSAFCKDREQKDNNWFVPYIASQLPGMFKQFSSAEFANAPSEQQFADFLKFLDENDILESLQGVAEKAVHKLFNPHRCETGGALGTSCDSSCITCTESEVLIATSLQLSGQTSVSGFQSYAVTPAHEQDLTDSSPESATFKKAHPGYSFKGRSALSGSEKKQKIPSLKDLDFLVRKKLSFPSNASDSMKKSDWESALSPSSMHEKASSSPSLPDPLLRGAGRGVSGIQKKSSICSSLFASQGESEFLASVSQPTSPHTHISSSSDRYNHLFDFLEEKKVFAALHKVVDKAVYQLMMPHSMERSSLETSTASSLFKQSSIDNPLYHTLHATGGPSGTLTDATPSQSSATTPTQSTVQPDAAFKKATKKKSAHCLLSKSRPISAAPEHRAKPPGGKSVPKETVSGVQQCRARKNIPSLVNLKKPTQKQEASTPRNMRECGSRYVAPVKDPCKLSHSDSEIALPSIAAAKADSKSQLKPIALSVCAPKPNLDTANRSKPNLDSTNRSKPSLDSANRPKKNLDSANRPEPKTQLLSQLKPMIKMQPVPSTKTTQKRNLVPPPKTKPKLAPQEQPLAKLKSQPPPHLPHPPKPKQKLQRAESFPPKAPKQAVKAPRRKGLAPIIRKPCINEYEAISRWLSLPRNFHSDSTLRTMASYGIGRQYTREEVVECLIENAVSLMLFKYKTEKNLAGKLGFISQPFADIYNQKMAEFMAPNVKLQWPITLQPLTMHEEGCLASHPLWACTMGDRVQLPWKSGKNRTRRLEYPAQCEDPYRDETYATPELRERPYPSVTATTRKANFPVCVKIPGSLNGKKTMIPFLPQIS
ncbi:uncharacterized protein LOC142465231 [Ascaphus truei]|uniref:uncharacterized protein LOC142465231 n=1 Tax=Ascaphus truei TaxID=8439 RepID=UPI003F59E15A